MVHGQPFLLYLAVDFLCMQSRNMGTDPELMDYGAYHNTGVRSHHASFQHQAESTVRGAVAMTDE
jgi:hypothetical protein